MNPSFLVLLGFLLGGSSGDLLDHVPTQLYWQDRAIAIDESSMLREASPQVLPDVEKLFARLSGDDPKERRAAAAEIVQQGAILLPKLQEAADSPDAELAQSAQLLRQKIESRSKTRAVRRLMAIRALGEIKSKAAGPFLQSQLTSAEPFVAHYARRAIDQIEGRKTSARPDPAAQQDIWLLPAQLSAVAQLVPRGRGALDLEYLQAHLDVAANQDKGALAEKFSGICLDLAERIGDVRVDAISAGVSPDFDAQHGYLVAILSGQFDAAAGENLARQLRVARKTADGKTVYSPDGDTAFFFDGDRRLVLLASPEGEKKLPVEQVVASVAGKQQSLKQSEAVAKLALSVMARPPEERVAWAAVKMCDAYRQLPGIDGFTQIVVRAEEHSGTLIVRASAQTSDAATATAAAESIRRNLADAEESLRQLQPTVPAIALAVEALQSAKFGASGSDVGAEARIEDSISTQFLLPMILSSGGAGGAEDGSAVEANLPAVR